MSAAPTTDCPTCGRSAKTCNDDRARGWGHCCLTCQERGSLVSHQLRAFSIDTKEADRG